MAISGPELLTAAQGCDFHAPLASSPALERLRSLLRAAARPMVEPYGELTILARFLRDKALLSGRAF